jgi:molybdate transport system ATP-binding protein
MIEIAVRHRLGAFVLDAAFTAEGGLTALFGRSGSGKTSLVNIIAGLIRPEHGRVVVHRETLTDTERGLFVPPKKRRVGYVFQEGRLFPHMTVRQNLLYGRWFAPRYVREGGRPGEIDHVVELLGIGGLLGRRPANLSGGEKQRVAIARALLKNPAILIFDEATSALDSKTEKAIQAQIERAAQGRTALVIAHRLSTIMDADEIIVLDKGRIVERGRHTPLLAQSGAYAQMWLLQQQEEAAAGAEVMPDVGGASATPGGSKA